MRRIFADTYYWIALLNPKDDAHRQAVAMGESLRGATLITTDEVLNEVLAFFSRYRSGLRLAAVSLIENILADSNVIVLPQSHDSFLEGLALYKARPDKGFSLTDCIVMTAMRREGVLEVLTHDEHFLQEGFTPLL